MAMEAVFNNRLKVGANLRPLAATCNSIVLWSGICGCAGVAQGPVPAEPAAVSVLKVVESKRVPAGTIAGVVVDGDTGEPIGNAQVTLNRFHGVVTDARGRFNLTATASLDTLRIEFLGFAPIESLLSWSVDRGYAALAEMKPVPITICGASLSNAVHVSVHDALTASAPAATVRLRVFNDGRYSTASGKAIPGADAVHLAAGNSSGTYSAEVSADGYRSWSKSDIHVGIVCGLPHGQWYRVWLLPN